MFDFLKPTILKSAEAFIEQCLPKAKVSLSMDEALPTKDASRKLVQLCLKQGFSHIDLAVMLCDVAFAQEQGIGERTKEVFAQQGELGQLVAAVAEGRLAEHDQLLSTVFSAAFGTMQLRAFPRNGIAGARCQENLGKWLTQ